MTARSLTMPGPLLAACSLRSEEGICSRSTKFSQPTLRVGIDGVAPFPSTSALASYQQHPTAVVSNRSILCNRRTGRWRGQEIHTGQPSTLTQTRACIYTAWEFSPVLCGCRWKGHWGFKFRCYNSSGGGALPPSLVSLSLCSWRL